MLESAIAAGVAAAGGDALLAGVLPTPAAPLLVRRHGLDLGVVISASHNPFEDNGIKFFAPTASSSPTTTRARDRGSSSSDDRSRCAGADRPRPALRRQRSRTTCAGFEHALPALDLDGLRVAARLRQRRHVSGRAADLPAARAPTSTCSPIEPDGRNINHGCGSTHLDALAARSCGGGHDLGFAFDGDGDRVLAVDRDGDRRRRRRADRARRAAPARARAGCPATASSSR